MSQSSEHPTGTGIRRVGATVHKYEFRLQELVGNGSADIRIIAGEGLTVRDCVCLFMGPVMWSNLSARQARMIADALRTAADVWEEER